MTDDLRLIEDYLPIEAISAEASREKSVRKGHISTLHLWWARRPLVACRAAVYGALVPADRWVKDLNVKNTNGHDAESMEAFKKSAKRGLNRKAAKDFVTKLCRYPKTNPTKESDKKIKRDTEAAIVEAQRHILEAHAERLTAELAEAKKSGKKPAWVDEFKLSADKVSYDDIVAGRAPRPRVLDMFAGGGAIPLEALRLGCEAYALDLNPVAHIIQLCTLVYPQKYGNPDLTSRGMTGPKNEKGETTWGGLAAEVRYWGNWVYEAVRREIGDLYPPIPDPGVWDVPPEISFNRETGQWNIIKPGKTKRGVALDTAASATAKDAEMFVGDNDEDDEDEFVSATVQLPPGFLQPVAYLWTRSVRCKNPNCNANVPLVRQTWLCKKPKRFVALKMNAPKKSKRVVFEVVESDTELGLGFDPEGFSQAGNATCLYCGTVSDNDYVKVEGCAGRMLVQSMATVCICHGRQGKVYLSTDSISDEFIVFEDSIQQRLKDHCRKTGMSVPDETISTDAKNSCWTHLYGLSKFGDLFTSRQKLSQLGFAWAVHHAHERILKLGHSQDHGVAVAAYLACNVDKQADRNSQLCVLLADGGRGIKNTFARQALPMTWDFSEANPFNPIIASWQSCFREIVGNIIDLAGVSSVPARPTRCSATEQPFDSETLDAIITDPPYYDNVPYANISDFFYVWLKRSVGHLYREHLSSATTPKKQEAVADATRHGGDKAAAVRAYENMMAKALSEAHRVLKPGGSLAVVYAHKTTLGWSTLVDAFRRAGFVVGEAWPLDTENVGRLRAQSSAALASSIFLVGRKRAIGTGVGNYENDVQPELQHIVRERVDTLWNMGIAGADLVIACVGAGLRAFTKYEKVEYANGEEVPAEKFLAEVEGAVLDRMMEKLFKQTGGKVSAIDPASRFYVLWRFVYKVSEIDAGEAIVFTYAQHVELDGPLGLSTGNDALIEKKKAKYRARDFTERGDHAKLGLPDDDGKTAPLIDVLHRVLWLMEKRPGKLKEFLLDANPDRERLRVLAQALAGAALSGKAEEDAEKLIGTTPAEKAALGKLLANWKSLVENAVETQTQRTDRQRGQKPLFD